MIANHCLRELFDFRILSLFLGKLAELYFGAVIGKQATGEKLINFLTLPAGIALGRSIVGRISLARLCAIVLLGRCSSTLGRG